MKTCQNFLWVALTSATIFSAVLPVVASPVADRPVIKRLAAEPASKYVTGSVTAKSDTELTVKTMTGESTTVLLTGSTVYSKDGKEAKADDVKVGSAVMVTTKTNSDGKLEAEKVNISESMAPKG